MSSLSGEIQPESDTVPVATLNNNGKMAIPSFNGKGTSTTEGQPSITGVANVKKATSSSEIEQTGKVFIGPGAKKEAEIIGIGLGKLSANQLDDLHKAEQFAMEQSIKYVMQKQQQAHQQHQQKIALYSQALSLMSRIYVGSINFDVYEDQIRQAFVIYGPIKNINMTMDPSTNNHKGFCFIEYEIPEAAYLARDSMNGRIFGGRNIKVLPVGRQDTMPQAQPIIDMVISEARQYNRVYVASVHPDIAEKDLRSVFLAFGEVTKCQLAKHPSGKGHRGFGYLEFKTATSVREAVEGMNGFDLGGQFLKVGNCVAPPDAINYLSTGKSEASALPAAAAMAAAEATARINAQQILGINNKSSPGSSPGVADPSSTTPNESQPQPAPSGRRRGFGGFASAPVPPPDVVQPALPPPGLAVPQLGANGEGSSSPVPGPQLVIPKLGDAPVPVQDTEQAEQSMESTESSMDAFYSTLKEEGTAAPRSLSQIPAIASTQNPEAFRQLQMQRQAKSITAGPIVLGGGEGGEPKSKKQKKEKKDFLERIGEKAKISEFDASKPASFAPLPAKIAPRDPRAEGEEGGEGVQLAIGGPESWMALSIYEGGGAVQKSGGDAPVAKAKQGKDGKQDKNAQRRRGRKSKAPKLSSGPKLNTAQKMAAANLAGALSDQLSAQNAQNDEASLASQEHVQIRGNDARHLLIQKLMRTNRSSVIVMRNMITPEGIDDDLEDEIREECSKYGRVTDVVIVNEEETQTVKIFVRFAEPVQAEEARKAIDGRYFDGRTVIAQSYDQTLFDHDDFTG